MDTIIVYIILTAVLAIVIGLLIGYVIRKNISEAKIGQAENLAKEIVEKANRDSETVKKEKLLEAKEEIHRLRTEGENENRERRLEVHLFYSLQFNYFIFLLLFFLLFYWLFFSCHFCFLSKCRFVKFQSIILSNLSIYFSCYIFIFF